MGANCHVSKRQHLHAIHKRWVDATGLQDTQIALVEPGDFISKNRPVYLREPQVDGSEEIKHVEFPVHDECLEGSLYLAMNEYSVFWSKGSCDNGLSQRGCLVAVVDGL